MGENGPAQPAVKAGLSMIESAVKASLPAETLSEPGLLREATASVVIGSALGQNDVVDALLMSIGLVVRREQPTIRAGERCRAIKKPAMMVQTGPPLVGVGGIAWQDAVLADEAAI